MRLVTTSDGTSLTVTGLRVLASLNSPRMTRPPCFGWPAAAVATVGPGTAGGFAAAVGCAPVAAAGAVVAAGALVAAGAAVGTAPLAGPHAASNIVLAANVDTIRPLTVPCQKSMQRGSLSLRPVVRRARAFPPAPARRPSAAD